MLSDDAGNAQGGAIDSGALSGLLTYSLGGHAFGAGLQKMNGDTSMPYLNGTAPYLANYIQLNDFAEPGERSWQLRYDYNFAAIGIPRLTFMTRYVKGDHADPASAAELAWLLPDAFLSCPLLRSPSRAIAEEPSAVTDNRRLSITVNSVRHQEVRRQVTRGSELLVSNRPEP